MERIPAMQRTLLALVLICSVSALSAQPPEGPPTGWLVIHGGGRFGTRETIERFRALAGGPDATLVAIPTASGQDPIPESYRIAVAARFAFRNVVVLHTTDRQVADSEAFAEPLRHASAVWFDGG